MNAKKLLKEAQNLPATERALLIEELLSSLDKEDESIDNLWKIEVEDRIKAYKEKKKI
jgi:putative addiction module component (TIGR02574 family)